VNSYWLDLYLQHYVIHIYFILLNSYIIHFDAIISYIQTIINSTLSFIIFMGKNDIFFYLKYFLYVMTLYK
jgi:hypothetical protein